MTIISKKILINIYCKIIKNLELKLILKLEVLKNNNSKDHLCTNSQQFMYNKLCKNSLLKTKFKIWIILIPRTSPGEDLKKLNFQKYFSYTLSKYFPVHEEFNIFKFYYNPPSLKLNEINYKIKKKYCFSILNVKNRVFPKYIQISQKYFTYTFSKYFPIRDEFYIFEFHYNSTSLILNKM